jgi:hypothetical protein
MGYDLQEERGRHEQEAEAEEQHMRLTRQEAIDLARYTDFVNLLGVTEMPDIDFDRYIQLISKAKGSRP